MTLPEKSTEQGLLEWTIPSRISGQPQWAQEVLLNQFESQPVPLGFGARPQLDARRLLPLFKREKQGAKLKRPLFGLQNSIPCLSRFRFLLGAAVKFPVRPQGWRVQSKGRLGKVLEVRVGMVMVGVRKAALTEIGGMLVPLL